MRKRNLIWAGCLTMTFVAVWAVVRFAATTHCLRCGTTLEELPYLLGPTTHDGHKLQLAGMAVNAGTCIGPETVLVCRECRRYWEADMQIWRPLPRDFGTMPIVRSSANADEVRIDGEETGALSVTAEAALVANLPLPKPDRNSPVAIEAGRVRGAAAARKDIQAGKPRIRYYGKPWSANKPLIDDATGYPVEIVAGCIVDRDFAAEVHEYSDTMREWHTQRLRAANPPEKSEDSP